MQILPSSMESQLKHQSYQEQYLKYGLLVISNLNEVLDVATNMKADGLTAAAAGLWPYYSAKKIVKFFIVVTDEIDNEKYKGQYFPTLFQKYYNEIFPAKIVFVSFLENPSEKGRMVKALENMGITPLQFKLDGKRPDLTKLDSLLGTVCMIVLTLCRPARFWVFLLW